MSLLHARLEHPDYGFTVTDVSGNSMQIDIPVEQGGGGKGLRPMQTMLAALCGCSGVDMIGILKKQRQEIASFDIRVGGEREQGKEPSLWKQVEIRFELNGAVDPAKAWRAADLSINKYCSVAETLRRAGAQIHFNVVVNGEAVTKPE